METPTPNQNTQPTLEPERVIPLSLGQLRRLTSNLDDGAKIFVRCWNFEDQDLQKVLSEDSLGLDAIEVFKTLKRVDGEPKVVEEVYLDIDFSKDCDCEGTT